MALVKLTEGTLGPAPHPALSPFFFESRPVVSALVARFFCPFPFLVVRMQWTPPSFSPLFLPPHAPTANLVNSVGFSPLVQLLLPKVALSPHMIWEVVLCPQFLFLLAVYP